MTDRQELHEQIKALVARVQLLEDQHSIAQVVARYGPAADAGAADAAADLWTDDGVFDVLPAGRWVGHGEIAGMYNAEGHQGLIMNGCGHVLTAPQVSVDGDEATAWNHALNIRYDRDADRFWVARLSANEWHLRRIDGRWRVVNRINRNLDGSAEPREVFGRAASAG